MDNIKSLYIHIPFCFSKCKYCDFFSEPYSNKKSVPSEYISALCKELKFRFNQFKCKSIDTIYIGGGTPSLMTQNQLSEILDTVKKCTHISEDCEITIEMNPDDVTQQLLEEYQKVGITRLSVGVQSMNDQVLKFAGRRACAIDNIRALECIKKNWKKELSLDLISALPLETKESFIQGLEKIISYNPDHISLYSLTIEEETPFGRMLEKNQFEYDFDFADELWLCGKAMLRKNDYIQYEVSNFAKNGKECRHNLTYWKHGNYIGAGCGATGTVYPNRWTNKTNISEYMNFWNNEDVKDETLLYQENEKLSDSDMKFEFFMMGLRKSAGITEKEYFDFFNEDLPETFLILFNKWKEKQLACMEKTQNVNRYFLTEQGLLYLNNFLEQLEL